MKTKLLIFDLDGTLIDSANDIVTAVNNLLLELGKMPLDPQIIRNAIGEGFRKLIWDLFPTERDEQSFVDHLESRLMHYYEKHLLDTTKAYDGVIEYLGSTPFKIALVTNKPIAMTNLTLPGVGLDKFPWVKIFGGDSLEKKKPDPLPLLEVMKAAGVTPNETLMIGDGIPDLLAGKEARVRVIGCEYGYTRNELMHEIGAAKFISKFSDLPSAIASLN